MPLPPPPHIANNVHFWFLFPLGKWFFPKHSTIRIFVFMTLLVKFQLWQCQELQYQHQKNQQTQTRGMKAPPSHSSLVPQAQNANALMKLFCRRQSVVVQELLPWEWKPQVEAASSQAQGGCWGHELRWPWAVSIQVLGLDQGEGEAQLVPDQDLPSPCCLGASAFPFCRKEALPSPLCPWAPAMPPERGQLSSNNFVITKHQWRDLLTSQEH